MKNEGHAPTNLFYRRTSRKKFTKSKKKTRTKFRKSLKDINDYQDLWRKALKSDKCSCGPIKEQSQKASNITNNRIVNGEEAKNCIMI